MDAVVALIHSPLAGPLTWSLVAVRLRESGIEARTPGLRDSAESDAPYWRQHAESVAEALQAIPPDRPLILVGHSGAGSLLPAIRQAAGHPVAGYIFVDAGLPHDGRSRLDEMEAESPEYAAELREHLVSGGRFPEWSDDDLRDILADERLRRQLVAELRPRALDYFTEPVPVISGWPDAPCSYIQLSPAYARPAAEARHASWPVRTFDAGHFHMLVDPDAVAAALQELM
jgi:pimeloyl-ACP methyl ester carboxylesterase